MFNISRVVDDGTFHKLLDPETPTQIKLINDIPVCCKINLEGKTPPLQIRVTVMEKKSRVQAFASYIEV
mgnify:FL=1